MRSSTQAFRGLLVAFAMVALVACGGKQTGDDFVSLYPPALEELRDGQYSAAISAIGVGTHPQRNIAASRAAIDADAKIAQQFNSEIANLTQAFTEAVNDEALEHFQQTTENFSLAEVQGIQEVRTVVRQSESGYEAFVLKVVNPEIMKDLIDQQRNALTEFKATQAYQDLEQRVEEYRARQN
ncbi:hypothetical protein [Chitinivibrio alkaliphilus]|uniref:LPP20 lipoprotein n=1 Tax=Chitinivibrio alkaliphilus ACht1 TaxID=1313304 RepID=U7D5F8_9BACT|nr:hypothetical protein [Chitinivibrio alkaliphilus]ERP30796.1 hypothetical protein CALK_2362 [Chitinivibrio alkaliphilus ACht1]